LVILHQYFTRFWLFCISFLRDFGYFASAFLGAMREARAVVCRSRIAKNRLDSQFPLLYGNRFCDRFSIKKAQK